MADEDRLRVQMIHGDVEESLDLSGMEVHGNHAIGTSGGDKIGHELGANGSAALMFLILAGVAEVGHYGGDPSGGGPTDTVEHDKELDHVIIYRFRGGLNDEDIPSANIFLDLEEDFTVGEVYDAALRWLASNEELDRGWYAGPIGLVDDVVIATATLSRLLNHVHPDVVRSHWSGQGDALEVIQRVTRWSESLFTARIPQMVRSLVRPGLRTR